MAEEHSIVVKIGGRLAEDAVLTDSLGSELASMGRQGRRIALVHGGGVVISTLQKDYGIQPMFDDGLRRTSVREMDLVDMALAGAVNTRLVRRLRHKGAAAWGLSGVDGGLLTARSLTDRPEDNRTGTVSAAETGPLTLLWDAGYLPVIAPVAADSEGRGMNVNADEAALGLAEALESDVLAFISDVPGVMNGADVIPDLDPAGIEELITGGVIAGGMIPKVRSAVGALQNGVAAVVIGTYAVSGDLERLIAGASGTRISAQRSESHGQ